MNLLRWEVLSTEETLDRFRRTRLRGFDRPYVYEQARLSLVPAVDTDRLAPAQRYVLQADIDSILTLQTLFAREGIDIFALQGAILFWLERDGEEEGPIPLCPPLVEESREAGGHTVWLINDGMHRIAAARSLGRPINVILAEGVPADFPYYAFPLSQGWAEVQLLPDLPEVFEKKAYRDPGNYKALFRDFNEVFPGIQKQRKQTNPAEIRE